MRVFFQNFLFTRAARILWAKRAKYPLLMSKLDFFIGYIKFSEPCNLKVIPNGVGGHFLERRLGL